MKTHFLLLRGTMDNVTALLPWAQTQYFQPPPLFSMSSVIFMSLSEYPSPQEIRALLQLLWSSALADLPEGCSQTMQNMHHLSEWALF